MMTYKIIYTQKALADLDAVASYIKLKLCFMSCAKMKVLFMSFVFFMLSVLGKIFCASMSKKKAADLCLFLRRITYRKKSRSLVNKA